MCASTSVLYEVNVQRMTHRVCNLWHHRCSTWYERCNIGWTLLYSSSANNS